MHEGSTSGAIKDLERCTRCIRRVDVSWDYGMCGSVGRYLLVGAFTHPYLALVVETPHFCSTDPKTPTWKMLLSFPKWG